MVRKLSDTNFTDNLTDLAEGRLNNEELEARRPYVPGQTFARMIVMEVISDSNAAVTEEKRKKWQMQGVRKLDDYVNFLPRNTIIAKKVGEDVSPMFCFPFFPSHMSLPCKPGECVWVMFEKPDAQDVDIGYWFCRVVEPHVVDDVNHSHPGRAFEPSLRPGTKDRAQAATNGTAETGENVWHELRNSPVVKINGRRTAVYENIILKGEKEDIFETLITNTDASKLMTYESVPRFRKRPGDVALEGSNNTLVVLGTDRKGPIAKSPQDEFPAGSIDIVAGRGQTTETYGKETATTRVQGSSIDKKGPEIKKELNKSPDILEKKEGDPDYINDSSRILVSQRTKVDQNFGLQDYNSKLKIEDSKSGDAGIIIKSDKVRLIARSDVEILVTGFDPKKSPNGKEIKGEKPSSNWASIVIRSNGDIVITPAEEGVLKLGGEEANKAVLCSTANVTGGQVTAPPLTDTMGGSLGVVGAAPTGVFATKVVLK